MYKSIRNFRQGLFLTTETDEMPDGSLLRARGVSPLNYGRSRPGSNLIHNLDAHSIVRFNNIVHSGVGTAFYRALSSIKTGLSGDRLSFASMPPTSGVVDYLFVAGGGELFKVDSSGNVTAWGIEKPSSDPSAAVGAAGNLTGTYKYLITFQNITTGHRSLPNDNEATATPTSQKVDLSSIPTSSDSQVTRREIWRTLAGGTIFFRLDTIDDNTTTTYTDDIVDADLEDTELPYDNIVPYDFFDDCAGPHNASMFWITRSESGKRGRLYYSAIGRPEAMAGFVDVTGDDDPLQKIVFGNGFLVVFSESRCFQILGTNPYAARELAHVPGTSKPHTVAVTSGGALYEANDGVRLLQGLQAPLVSFEPIGRLFRNENLGSLNAFSGVVAVYARDEYIISDTSQTIALNILKGTWRDLGIGCNAFHYASDADIIYANLNNRIVDLEKAGTVDDAGASINFELEPRHLLLSIDKKAVVQWVHIEGITQDESFTVTLILDGVEIPLGSFSATATGAKKYGTFKWGDGTKYGFRSRTATFNVNKKGHIAGVRISGTVSAQVEIFAVTLDAYIPSESQ